MSEFRQDPTSGTWVIVAPERAQRPGSWRTPDAADVATYDPTCPFCPGNEHLASAIIAEQSATRLPGWYTRVVPNKYPAVSPHEGTAHPASPYPAVAGHGRHEVIVETPRHDGDLTSLDEAEMAAVVDSYWQRYVALRAEHGIKAVVVFRNHRRHAGGSLAHPHAQIVALGMVPPWLATVANWCRDEFHRHSRCATCDMLARDLAEGQRLVEATERFALLVPFAASSPFEQWLVPRSHQASFAQSDAVARREMAMLFQRALLRLRTVRDDPPYNFAIESWQANGADQRYTHWRLRIVPRLGFPGGFELGSGLPINSSRPEADAAALAGVRTISP